MNSAIYSKNVSYFLKCADLKSISKAAQALNLTQSALSLSLRRLEEDLGFELFFRGRGLGALKLTEAGEKLLGHLKAQERLDDLFFQNEKVHPYSLKIASIQYVSRKYLMPSLERTNALADARVFAVRSAKALDAIKADRIDMALILSHSLPIRDPRFCFQIKEEQVGFVGLQKKFPSVARAKSFDEIKNLPLIIGDRIRDDWYASLDDYQRAYYVEDHFSARMLVLGGYGVGPFQLDYFTSEELKLLAVSKFKMPSTGWRLFAVLNRKSHPEALQKCHEIILAIKQMIEIE